MANYDKIGKVILPVFIQYDTESIWERSGQSFKIFKEPYTSIEVDIYEYTGAASAIDYLEFSGFNDIGMKLAAIYNTLNLKNPSQVYLGVFDNYSEWSLDTYVNGTFLHYFRGDDENQSFIGFINGRYSSAVYSVGFPDYAVIIQSPTSGKYWAIRLSKSIAAGDESYVATFSGITGDTGIDLLVNYTGQQEKPIENPNPYAPGGLSGSAGGNGSFSGPGGSWGNGIGKAPSYDLQDDVPNGSTEVDSSNSGIFTRYAMTTSDLFVLGAALYGENILTKIGKEVMSFLWNSPNEALISLISYPFDVSQIVLTADSSIKFGSLQLDGVSGKRLFKSFASIDWGTIQLTEYWGNFLDYAPHTKIELYLPWCTGVVAIDPHDCLPGSLRVVTNIELAKGTCIHNIFGNKGALIGTYSGTCGSQLPMTAIDSSGKALGIVTAAASAIVAGVAGAGAKSAGIAAANDPQRAVEAFIRQQKFNEDPFTARLIVQQNAIAKAEAPYNRIKARAANAAVYSSVAAFRSPPSVTRSGTFTANGAGMSVQFPYVIVSRPEQNVPDKYGHYYGYPSNVYTQIGNVRGYTEIAAIHLEGIGGATIDELDELEAIIKGGIIL